MSNIKQPSARYVWSRTIYQNSRHLPPAHCDHDPPPKSFPMYPHPSAFPGVLVGLLHFGRLCLSRPKNGTAALALYASISSIKDIFTYLHIKSISIAPFHKLPNSKTTTHTPTLENTTAPSNQITHFYYPLVTHRGSPSLRVLAECGCAPTLIGITPWPVLAAYGVIPASTRCDCVPRGYD